MKRLRFDVIVPDEWGKDEMANVAGIMREAGAVDVLLVDREPEVASFEATYGGETRRYKALLQKLGLKLMRM